MNPATAIALVLTACCGRLVVRANVVVDRGQPYGGSHVGGHSWAGLHGPKYRKISLIGGGGGGGCGGSLRPTASASIASTASVSLPHLRHGHQRPALATYCSRSGPGLYGWHRTTGENRLLGKLLAKKSATALGGGCGCGCGGGGGGGGDYGHARLKLAGPTCCGPCGCGGVHH